MNLQAKHKDQILEAKNSLREKWELTQEEHRKVSTCQSRIWELYIEINAIGALFRNMKTCDISADEYYGISLCLHRMGRRLGKIHVELGKVAQEIPQKAL